MINLTKIGSIADFSFFYQCALSEADKIVERLAATKKDVSSVRLVTIPEPSSAEIGIMDDDINMQTDDPKDQYQRKQRKIMVSNFTL